MKNSVVPEPQRVEIKTEQPVFTLNRLAEISADEESKKGLCSMLSFFKKAFEIEPVGTGKQSIELKTSKNIPEKEGYRLTVSENRAVIEGADEAGVFWGVQTFCELLFENDRSLCALEIYDYPLIERRGFMLDCSSWFFTTEAVKLFLDAMAAHKLNVFHWLLTGDAGWRLELFDNYLLTQIGGYRAFTGLGKVPHGGFYSREDTLEIIRYAHERCITVIPEISLPDRTTAAVAAYPQLNCFNKKVLVATDFGEQKNALCLGKTVSYDFLRSVLDETAKVFTDGVICIGGEKIEKTNREGCLHCKEKMRELSLQSENELYEYFLEQGKSHLDSLGVKTVIRAGKLNFLNGAIYECKTAESAKRAEASGAMLIDSGLELSKPYSLLTVEECYCKDIKKTASLFAAEAVLKTESIPTMKKAGELLFPRLGAFSENVWTKKEGRSYRHFLEKLDDYYRMIEFLPFDRPKKRQAFPGAFKKAGESIKAKLQKRR